MDQLTEFNKLSKAKRLEIAIAEHCSFIFEVAGVSWSKPCPAEGGSAPRDSHPSPATSALAQAYSSHDNDKSRGGQVRSRRLVKI